MITCGYDRFPLFCGFDFQYNSTERFLVVASSPCKVLIPRAGFYSSDFRLFPCNADNWLYNHPGIWTALYLYTHHTLQTLQLGTPNKTQAQAGLKDSIHLEENLRMRITWVNNYVTVFKFNFVCTCVSKHWLPFDVFVQ